MTDVRFCWQSVVFQLVWQHLGVWPVREYGQRLIERQRGDQVCKFMAERAAARMAAGEQVDTKAWHPRA